VGFAAVWDDPPEPTWSYTPWSLLQALQGRLDVVDLGLAPSKPARTALKLVSGRLVDGEPVSLWRSSRVTDRYLERALDRAVAQVWPDVVLQVLDIAPTEVPYVLYQDMSWRLLQQLAVMTPVEHLGHVGMSKFRMAQRAEREVEVHAGASGLAVLSTWVRDFLVEECDVPADRVTVVRPGCNVSVVPTAEDLDRRLGRARRELLFVGRDFVRKAGDVVVGAVETLRAEGEDVRLTVVGPDEWPLPGQVPEGVEFRGRVPREQLDEVFAASDLFVMPSRFEAYGIAFVEALSAGVPCIGRAACAMPEIIDHGVNGCLVGDLEVETVAKAIATTLSDDRVYQATAGAAADVAAYYTWERAADELADFLRSRVEELAA
jgi:glycosyltransferase involved in cell wall biosynthesis